MRRSAAIVFGVLALGAWHACTVDRKTDSLRCTSSTQCEAPRTCTDGYCVADPNCPSQCTGGCDTTANPPTCNVTDPGGSFNCPDGSTCTITCTSDGACGSIACGDAAACTIVCATSNACGDITCGSGKNGACEITCTGSNACGNVTCNNACTCDVICGPGECGTNNCPFRTGNHCTNDGTTNSGTTCSTSFEPGCNGC